MTRNVGSIDKGLRIAAGLALLGLGAFGPLGSAGRDWSASYHWQPGLWAAAQLTACWG